MTKGPNYVCIVSTSLLITIPLLAYNKGMPAMLRDFTEAQIGYFILSL